MAKVTRRTKQVRHYELPLLIQQLEEGGFLARCEKLPGCMAEGDTMSEALANVVDVAINLIDLYEEKGMPIKLKLIKQFSVKTPLRLDFPLPYQLA